MSYDTYIGEHERRRLGDALWSRRVRNVVEGLRPVFLWDRLYLGGGNSRLITPAQLARMGDDVVVVPNTAGILGGVRAWTLGTAGCTGRCSPGRPRCCSTSAAFSRTRHRGEPRRPSWCCASTTSSGTRCRRGRSSGR